MCLFACCGGGAYGFPELEIICTLCPNNRAGRSPCFLGAGNTVCNPQPSDDVLQRAFWTLRVICGGKKMPTFDFCLLIFSWRKPGNCSVSYVYFKIPHVSQVADCSVLQTQVTTITPALLFSPCVGWCFCPKGRLATNCILIDWPGFLRGAEH